MPPRAQVVTLRDGRALGLHEFGDPAGKPCVYIPGTPASGQAGALYHAAADLAGVRLIALDKPGYGLSDMTSTRTLGALGQDVRDLAVALDLQSFSLFGESGGGPQALAATAVLAGRVRLTVIASGMGPVDAPGACEGMKASNRRLLRVARHAPLALWAPMALTRRALLDPRRRAAFVLAQLAAAGPADRRAMEEMAAVCDVTEPAREALRKGTRGVVAELGMLARPWDFDLGSIASRVELWHGSEDVNVPPTVAQFLADRLPNAVAHLLQGEGHAVGWSQRHALMSALATTEVTA